MDESFILIHGHSMGGGILGMLTQRYQRLAVISDRSFRSLAAVVRAFMTHLAPFMSTFLGAILVRYLPGNWLTLPKRSCSAGSPDTLCHPPGRNL